VTLVPTVPAGPEARPPIVVLGGGGHAKVVIAVLKHSGHDVLGYTDQRDQGAILSVPYLGDDVALPGILQAQGHCGAVVGVGKIDVSPRRLVLQAAVTTLGFEFPVIVSRHAVVNEEVWLGQGTVVVDGVVVNSGSKIGRACILNTNSTVEHDCRIGDNVHVAPGATLSGGVTVGDNCLIGAGSTIIQGVSVCADCLVGAGSAVVSDLTDPGTYVGIPARRTLAARLPRRARSANS
jgi:sugar O-acyltransferase (sialic acid O-acetyltransferase NeuD family)